MLNDGVIQYMSILAAVFIPLGLFVAYMARRQRLEEEAAEDAQDPHHTPAE